MRWIGVIILAMWSFALPEGARAEESARADGLCFDPFDAEDPGAPCPIYPRDLPSFSRSLEYFTVARRLQRPFDLFAWQGFVALNWDQFAPASRAGNSASQSQASSPDDHQRWRDFARKDALVDDDPAGACGSGYDIYINDLVQADGHVVIAQNGLPLVYETRLNAPAAAHLRAYIAAGNAQAPALLPAGDAEGTAPAVHTKTAWMMLEAPRADMVSARGAIFVDAAHSATGKGFCLTGEFGLVGMHITTKITSGHGDKWLWATFEHVDTVPVARTARRVNSLFSKDLFPEGCPAPADAPAGLLFDARCPSCPTNTPPEPPLWSANPPYAHDPQGAAIAPSRITRCWQIFEHTQAINAHWQRQLAGTPLAHYQLITTQWRGGMKTAIFEQGEVPRYVSNTTMETYLQTDPAGSCMGCHVQARTTGGAFADFAFYFGELRP